MCSVGCSCGQRMSAIINGRGERVNWLKLAREFSNKRCYCDAKRVVVRQNSTVVEYMFRLFCKRVVYKKVRLFDGMKGVLQQLLLADDGCDKTETGAVWVRLFQLSFELSAAGLLIANRSMPLLNPCFQQLLALL